MGAVYKSDPLITTALKEIGMAVNQNSNVAYGLSQPLVDVPLPTIVSNRAPTANDNAPIGTQWVNPLTNDVYVLTSRVLGVSVWSTTSGGGGVFAAITVTTGPNAINGITTINGPGSASLTSIGTGGTGAVVLGNATGNTTIGAGNLTVTAGNFTLTLGNALLSAGNLGLTAGNVTLTNGNVNIGGNLVLTLDDSAVIFNVGPTITAGAGAPTAVEPKGSLYLRTDGTGVANRAYIAVDAAGTWTAISTVA